MRRLRQIVAGIDERLYYDQKQKRRLISWQARQLAQFIAATIPVEGENTALAVAAKLVLDEDELLELEAAEREPTNAIENDDGSYEKLMRGFRGG